MIRAGLAALVVVVAMPDSGVGGQFFGNGNKLLEACNGAHAACEAYVVGVADTMAAIQKGGGSLDGWMACVPDGVTGSQVNDVAMKYLAEHPQQRHFSAPSLIAKALSEAFPCPP